MRMGERLGRWFRRTGSEILGWTLVAIGIPMMPLPGPGTIVLVAGIALLAPHYSWARKILEPLRKQAVEAARYGVATLPRITISALGRPVAVPRRCRVVGLADDSGVRRAGCRLRSAASGQRVGHRSRPDGIGRGSLVAARLQRPALASHRRRRGDPTGTATSRALIRYDDVALPRRTSCHSTRCDQCRACLPSRSSWPRSSLRLSARSASPTPSTVTKRRPRSSTPRRPANRSRSWSPRETPTGRRSSRPSLPTRSPRHAPSSRGPSVAPRPSARR